ncbi:MAG: nuclear transport factor 2 family protein [Actinobacteria bacterium]|nr:nuclear transport factor 2 family protein [Actinomycetota bacterium]
MSDRAEANKKLILDYFDAWARGDSAEAEDFWAEDFVGFQAGHGVLAGYYRGRQAFHDGWIQRTLELTGGRWTVERAEVILAGEEGVVVIADEWMERDGKGRIDTEKLVVYTIRDGKILTCRMYDGDQGAIDDFYS